MGQKPETLQDLVRECERLRARVTELETEPGSRSGDGASPRLSEERLRAVVDNAPVVLWSVDLDGIFTLSDGKGLEKLGLRPGEVVGQSLYEIYRDFPDITQAVRRAMAGESLSADVEVGELAYETRYEPLRGPDGDVEGVLGLAMDVTDRRRAEGARSARKAEFERQIQKQRRLLEQGWDVIAMIDAEGTITFVSDSSAHILGYSPEEAIGCPVSDFVDVEDVSVVVDAIQGIIDRPIGPGTIEARVRHRDGSTRWMEIRGSNFLDDEAMQAIVVNCRDITERKGTEEELVRLERLRALGEMSAGVSHNLNNILTGVLAPAEMLKMRTRDPEDLRDIQDILSSGMRARDLVSRLHQAVRREAETYQSLDLNEAIQEAARVSRPRWRDEPEARGVAIDLALRLGEVDPIRGTWAGLQDIIINLLFNAVDAMPEGGTIRIATEAARDGARLTFEDTGIGMNEETRRRVFEPFFTTKPEVGTGLGLSTVFGTVGRWGGAVEVDSEPNRGTRFTFLLPGWEGEPQATETVPPQEPSATVLIVDDDGTVCDLLGRVLADGCIAKTASSAEEAVTRAKAGGVDAAVIDLGMPGVPGDRISAAVKAADPSISTVLMTGWDLGELGDRAEAFDFRIQKPFQDLTEVREIVMRAVELTRMRRETNKG